MLRHGSLARQTLKGVGAARVIAEYGRDGVPHIAVDEALVGVSLRSLIAARGPLPPAVVLTVGDALAALWERATIGNVPLELAAEGILIDSQGRVRFQPNYSWEESHALVGAAIMYAPPHVSYVSPEAVDRRPMLVRRCSVGPSLCARCSQDHIPSQPVRR